MKNLEITIKGDDVDFRYKIEKSTKKETVELIKLITRILDAQSSMTNTVSNPYRDSHPEIHIEH
jgi:hypothetical protein